MVEEARSGRPLALAALFTPQHRGGSGSPLVCIHGFTDTWRTWELVLPALERRHHVLAPTLPGHAGGPGLPDEITADTMADGVEAAMDAAGIATAHITGNSLGGLVALALAGRGRAESVVAFAPAGGWAADDEAPRATLEHFTQMQRLLANAAPQADAIVSSAEGRRRATSFVAERWEHIPAELIAHQMVGAAACDAGPLIAFAARAGWPLDPAGIDCPLRFAWGTADRILGWPSAAARFRDEWFPHADWVELDGVGHCPQLDVPIEAAELILGVTAR